MLLYPYRLANRCVTNGEWLAFMEAGGYGEPLVWLADGWATVKAQGWQAPGYWEQRDGVWHQMTLEGLLPVDPRAPVTHVSYFEANAFANWAGKRLPTEFEWEAASAGYPVAGNDLTTNALRPRPAIDAPATAAWRRCSATCGSGRRAPTCRTPATGPRPAPSANTTASSWSARTCCAAARAPLRRGTSAPPTATSSTRISAGSSPACALPRTPHERRTRRCHAVAAEARGDFADALIAGLSARQKSIPCRFFYDAAGSALFEAITELPEYYPTRTETAILREHAADMAALAAPGAVLIEFGSGSSTKTELLLAGMPDLYAYMPIDISGAALREAQARIAARFPRLAVLPVEADFSRPLTLGDSIAARPRLGFFPGSTIGNLTEVEAVELLANMRAILGDGAKLIIGADLKKDVRAPHRRLRRRGRRHRGVQPQPAAPRQPRAGRRFRRRAVRARGDLRRAQRAHRHAPRQPQPSRAPRCSATASASPSASASTPSTRTSTTSTASRRMARRAGWWPQVVWTDAEHLFSVHVLVAS